MRKRFSAGPILFLAASMCTLAGCPSYATFHSTRTAPRGKLEVSAGVSKAVAGETRFEQMKTHGVFIARLGLTDNLDMGLRLRSDLLAGVEMKLRFLDGERLQMAIAPGFSISILATAMNGLSRLAESLTESDEQYSSFFGYEAHLPLLFGIPFGDNIFIVGPKLALTNWNARVTDPSATLPHGLQMGALLWHPGVVLGLDWQLNEGMRLLPEINVHFDFSGSVFLHAGVAVYL